MAFVPYIRAIVGGTARPTGMSGIITTGIAFLACAKRADAGITRTGWLFFVSAMSSLPLWYLTSDPLWAVVVLTTVDVLGFGPTVRKAYSLPHSESLLFFALFAARYLLVIMALENYSLTTVVFPGVIAAACVLLMAMMAYRRRALAA
jgi:hypothetical protein